MKEISKFDCWNNMKPSWIFHIVFTDMNYLNDVVKALNLLEFKRTEFIKHTTEFILVNSGQMKVFCDGFENPAFETITDVEFLKLNEKFIFNSYHKERQDKLKTILE